MPTVFSHAVAGLALGTAFHDRRLPARFWVLGATCAVVPDLDVIGLRLGIPYRDMFGHRGITHSLPFAALLAILIVRLAFADRQFDGRRVGLWLFYFLATASHGVLDALTSGGGGIAFFAPFSAERFFLPWQPIAVSPISIRRFFSERGVRVLSSELWWVLLPSLAFAMTATAVRRAARRGAHAES